MVNLKKRKSFVQLGSKQLSTGVELTGKYQDFKDIVFDNFGVKQTFASMGYGFKNYDLLSKEDIDYVRERQFVLRFKGDIYYFFKTQKDLVLFYTEFLETYDLQVLGLRKYFKL